MNPTRCARGADHLVDVLLTNDIQTCFANPGTSEMHFVAALDGASDMKCVLSLFEGGATGAADGYYRMTGKPAATLLHLGPGLANGIANLHNAKKARSGIVNIVGEHATTHLALDAPLTSDIETLARPMSHWVKSVGHTDELRAQTQTACDQARSQPGRIATLIVPADIAWTGFDAPANPEPRATAQQRPLDSAQIQEAAAAIRQQPQQTLLLLGGRAGLSASTVWAERIAQATGVDVMTEFYVERLERGAGRPNFARIPYGAKAAAQLLSRYQQIILVCAKPPVAFFGYPDLPGELSAPGCRHILIADHDQDAVAALEALAQALDTPPAGVRPAVERRPLGTPDERLSPESVGQALAALLPENAIVVDEAITSGRVLHELTKDAAPHDWLSNMGGSIGYGLPVAVGAAVAAPDRRVIALEGDGSAMYTVQSLWTMARESLNVTVVIYANRKYQILLGEYRSVGGDELGERARRLLTIGEPDLDWCSLARSMGVPGVRVTCTSEFMTAFQRANSTPGPSLIEIILD